MKKDDWVVVGGLQQVRPHMEIRPDRTPMPSLGPASEIKGQKSEVGDQKSEVKGQK